MFRINRTFIADIIALLYVSLLLYTGIVKLIDHDLTTEQMTVMPIVGVLPLVASWLLPITEIIIAIIIFIPKTRKIGLYAGTGLMIWFILYIIYIMKYYSHLPCTCGGFIQVLSWPDHLVFNGIFVLLGILSLTFYKRQSKSKQRNLTFS